MITEDLSRLIGEALDSLRIQGMLPDDASAPITLDRPARPEHGDFATNISLALAKKAGLQPRALAEAIVGALPASSLIAKTEVAGPGFINFHLSDEWLIATMHQIASQKENFGRSTSGRGVRLQVEFVSANPNGPLHVGSGRNAAFGDALSRILEAVGYEVHREYYLNDAGKQMDKFARSLEARYRQALGQNVDFPEDGYQGEYLVEMGKRLASEEGMGLIGKPDEVLEWGLARAIESQRQTMERFRVRFDEWFSERSLHSSGEVDSAIERLIDEGLTYEQDGALWLKATEAGAPRDQPLLRSDRTPTYLAVDIAYLLNKLERGFDKAIYVWGADHHGNYETLRAAARLLKIGERIEIILYQLVNFMSGGKPVRMSRRTGDIVTMDELLDEVGVDAARYTLLTRSTDSGIDFDFELVKAESQDNPVYYIQYAHARNSSIMRYAQEQGVELKPVDEVDFRLLVHDSEHQLIRKLSEYPEVVLDAADLRAPYRLTNYLQALAAEFNGGFYRDCRVITDDGELTVARLWLVEATRQVVANALGLLGVTAPEKM